MKNCSSMSELVRNVIAESISESNLESMLLLFYWIDWVRLDALDRIWKHQVAQVLVSCEKISQTVRNMTRMTKHALKLPGML